MAKKKICRVEVRPTHVSFLRSESGGLEDVSYSKVYDNPSPRALFLLSRACNACMLRGDGILTTPLHRPEAVGWVWSRWHSVLSSETMTSIMDTYQRVRH